MGVRKPDVYESRGAKITFGKAVKSGFQHYVSWKGRASRSEYWWWALFVFLVTLPLNILYQVTVQSVMLLGMTDITAVFNWSFWLLVIVGLALFLPWLSILIRRLHDTDRSGGWFWIQLIPTVGAIVILVFTLLPSTPGPNRFDN